LVRLLKSAKILCAFFRVSPGVRRRVLRLRPV
jgi:hypothetical protein